MEDYQIKDFENTINLEIAKIRGDVELIKTKHGMQYGSYPDYFRDRKLFLEIEKEFGISTMHIWTYHNQYGKDDEIYIARVGDIESKEYGYSHDMAFWMMYLELIRPKIDYRAIHLEQKRKEKIEEYENKFGV